MDMAVVTTFYDAVSFEYYFGVDTVDRKLGMDFLFGFGVSMYWNGQIAREHSLILNNGKTN
jgi:hypothetical protein